MDKWCKWLSGRKVKNEDHKLAGLPNARTLVKKIYFKSEIFQNKFVKEVNLAKGLKINSLSISCCSVFFL